MRQTSLFVAALLVVLVTPLLTAATLQDFIEPYLYEGEVYNESVHIEQMDVTAGHFVLVKINEQRTFLLKRESQGNASYSYSFVNDTNSIFEVLYEFRKEQTYPKQEEIDEIGALIQAFNATRYPEEFMCLQSVGLNFEDAYCDPNRCQSCMSVPFCADKLPYFGLTFTQAIHDMDIASDGLTGSLANASRSIEEMNETGNPSEKLEDAVGNLTLANDYAIAMQATYLFGCDIPDSWCWHPTQPQYAQWCFTINLNYSLLSSAIEKASDLEERVVNNQTLTTRANNIYNKTNDRVINKAHREEDAAFEEFYALITERQAQVNDEASSILSLMSDPELSQDMALLNQLSANISQMGTVDRNFTAANQTSLSFYQLANKIEVRSENLTVSYGSLLNESKNADLALFTARLYLEQGDEDFATAISRYQHQKDAVDELILKGELTQGDIPHFVSDLDEITIQANTIQGLKSGRRTAQLGSWVGDIARGMSTTLIGAVSYVIPIDAQAKEDYSKVLPSALVILSGAGFYALALIAFIIMVTTKKIRLHKVALILWTIIFGFLFVMVGVGTITAHSLVQQQTERSVFGDFREAVANADALSVVVRQEANTTSSQLSVMKDCAFSIQDKLSELNKTVDVYVVSDSACSKNGVATADCDYDKPGTPKLSLSYSNNVSWNFYVLYVKEGEIRGDMGFYDECLLAEVFAGLDSW